MQPAFPSDHHFHDRRGAPEAEAALAGAQLSLADLTEQIGRGLEYLARQCLPAFDPSDPREQSCSGVNETPKS